MAIAYDRAASKRPVLTADDLIELTTRIHETHPRAKLLTALHALVVTGEGLAKVDAQRIIAALGWPDDWRAIHRPEVAFKIALPELVTHRLSMLSAEMTTTSSIGRRRELLREMSNVTEMAA